MCRMQRGLRWPRRTHARFVAFAVLALAQPVFAAPDGSRAESLEPHVVVTLPAGTPPHPLAVITPGCLGWHAHHDKWRRMLLERGYATLHIDSFAERGITDRKVLQRDVCTGRRVHGAARAADLMAVLPATWERPEIDAGHTVLFGWSHGGWSLLDFLVMTWAADARDAPLDMSGVRAAFLFYPYCGAGSLSGENGFPSHVRTIILHGNDDTVTAPGPCRARAAALRERGAAVDFVPLESAGHWFDNHAFRRTYDSQATRRTDAMILGILDGLR